MYRNLRATQFTLGGPKRPELGQLEAMSTSKHWSNEEE